MSGISNARVGLGWRKSGAKRCGQLRAVYRYHAYIPSMSGSRDICKRVVTSFQVQLSGTPPRAGMLRGGHYNVCASCPISRATRRYPPLHRQLTCCIVAMDTLSICTPFEGGVKHTYYRARTQTKMVPTCVCGIVGLLLTRGVVWYQWQPERVSPWGYR